MNDNNAESVIPEIPKFKENGRDATTLDCTPTPVYYGFNCRPRQVRYYKLSKSVDEILAGGFTRKSVEIFLAKVREKMCKAELKFAEYEDEVKSLYAKRNECQDSLARNLIKKRAGQIETRMSNYEYDTLGKYQRAVTKLDEFLK